MRVLARSAVFAIAIAVLSVAAVRAQDVSTIKASQTLERTVFKKILALPYYGVYDNIRFSIEGGTVTLSGKVADIRNRGDAEGAVKRIAGVEKVVNNIEVLPLSPFDDSIRRKMLRTFYRDGGSLYRYVLEPNPSIRIIVENGRVTLEGIVSSRGDAQLAYVLARGVPGTFAVTNNLVVAKNDR
jgi:hyperosmotically inducible protein